MRKIFFFLLMLLLVDTTTALYSDFNIQGILKDKNNLILSNTQRNFTFSIYDIYTGGSALWNVSINLTTDDYGIYDTILKTNLTYANQLYLGIKIDTDTEMTPRLNLTSTPYSYRSNISENIVEGLRINATSLNISGNVTFAQLSNCDTINTDANGLLTCGDDAVGGGLEEAWGNAVVNLSMFKNDTIIRVGNVSNIYYDYNQTSNVSLYAFSGDIPIITLGNISNNTITKDNSSILFYWNISTMFYDYNQTLNISLYNKSIDLSAYNYSVSLDNYLTLTDLFTYFTNNITSLNATLPSSYSNFKLENVSNNTLSKDDNATLALWSKEGSNIARIIGNVGIGTTSPATTLDVAGKANFTGNFSVGETSNILFVDNTSGRVGIGTKNPTEMLQITGKGDASADGLRITNIGTGGNAIDLSGASIGTTAGNWIYNSGTNYWRGDGQLRSSVEMYSLYGTFTSYMRTPQARAIASSGLQITDDGDNLGIFIKDGGNVGVGTNAPSDKLVVIGSANITGDLTVSGSNSPDIYIKSDRQGVGSSIVDFGTIQWSLYDDSAEESRMIGGRIRLQSNGNSWDGSVNSRDSDMLFSVLSDGSLVDNMIIKDNGNVGIGTISPTYKLTVEGNANVSSTLNVSGNISFTQLKNCDTINTDDTGLLTCGSDADSGTTLPDTSYYITNTTSYLGEGGNASVLKTENMSDISLYINQTINISLYNKSIDLSTYAFSSDIPIITLGNISNNTIVEDNSSLLFYWNISTMFYDYNQTSNNSLYAKKGGTLTDTKICTWDEANDEIDCDYTDVSGGGGGTGVWYVANNMIQINTTTSAGAVNLNLTGNITMFGEAGADGSEVEIYSNGSESFIFAFNQSTDLYFNMTRNVTFDGGIIVHGLSQASCDVKAVDGYIYCGTDATGSGSMEEAWGNSVINQTILKNSLGTNITQLMNNGTLFYEYNQTSNVSLYNKSIDLSTYAFSANVPIITLGNISNNTIGKQELIDFNNSLPYTTFNLENVSNTTAWENIINAPAYSNFQLSNVSNNTLTKDDNVTIIAYVDALNVSQHEYIDLLNSSQQAWVESQGYLSSGDFSNFQLANVSNNTINRDMFSNDTILRTVNMSVFRIDYHNLTGLPTCSGTDKLAFDGTDLVCSSDETGSGSLEEAWANSMVNLTMFDNKTIVRTFNISTLFYDYNQTLNVSLYNYSIDLSAYNYSVDLSTYNYSVSLDNYLTDTDLFSYFEDNITSLNATLPNSYSNFQLANVSNNTFNRQQIFTFFTNNITSSNASLNAYGWTTNDTHIKETFVNVTKNISISENVTIQTEKNIGFTCNATCCWMYGSSGGMVMAC